jgi:hypothetical protein
MEPEMLEFLKKISKSIFIAVAWLGVTSIAAIKGDNAFIEGEVRLGNVIFYIWFVISIVLVIWLYRKLWKPKESQ